MSPDGYPSRFHRGRGDTTRTAPRRGTGRPSMDGLGPRCAAPGTPSDEQAGRTGMSVPRLGRAAGRGAGARWRSRARRSTLDCLSPSASADPRYGSQHRDHRVGRCVPRASGRTSHACGACDILRRRMGRRLIPSWTEPGRTNARAAAGSSAPRKGQHCSCSGPERRRSRGCTWLSFYYAMCQGCHLHYDREHHAETARATRDAATGQGTLL